MTAEEFEEVVMTLILTYGLTKKQIAEILKVQPFNISRWLKRGVPERRAYMVNFRLKKFIRERGNKK